MITKMITEMVGAWAFWGAYSIIGPKLIPEKVAEKNEYVKAAKSINDFSAAIMGWCFVTPIICAKELYEKAYERFGS